MREQQTTAGNENAAGSAGDVELTQVLEAYLADLEAGRAVDADKLVADHPIIASRLRACLASLHLVEQEREVFGRGPEGAAGQGPALGRLGDFCILREIGRGGMGVVYEAEQISLVRRVALKVLPFAAALDPKQLQRFKNEAQAAAHLQHTNIVPVYYVGCERGVHFYAMQYIDGQTLAALIQELRRNDEGRRQNVEGRMTNDERMTKDECPNPKQPVPGAEAQTTVRHSTLDILSSFGIRHSSFPPMVTKLGLQAAEGLEHAHQLGVFHRDIKPANLILDMQGNLWITDFGLAQFQSQVGLTLSGDLIGTLRYMSPEQALAKRVAVDARTDVYSLGVTLYELLTLEPAYNGRDREELLRQIVFEEPRPLRRLNPAISPELETVVLKAMAKSPDERYASALELADDLRRILEDKPIRAKRPTLVQRTRKWARRHRTLVWALGMSTAVVLAVVIVALVISNVLISREQRQTRLSLYFNRIALAEREWAANNLTRVNQLLAECDTELRGWEWDYLRGLRRGGVTVLPLEKIGFCVAFSPDGELLAAGNSSGTVKIWNTKTWREIRTLPRQEGNLFTLAFSPRGRRLATASWNSNEVNIWDLDSDRVLHLRRDTINDMGQVVFSPDGRWLASAGGPVNRTIAIWDAHTGALQSTLPGHEILVQTLAFSPDGQRLASGGFDNTVKVWDLATGRQIWSHVDDTNEFYSVVYSPDGRLLAAAGGHHFGGRLTDIILWDAATLKVVRRLQGHTRSVLGLAFSPNGRRLASGSEDLTVKVWDVATGSEAITLHGHFESILGVAFSPDGHLLASAGGDGAVRIWDATPLEDNAGAEFLTFRGHTKEVYCVAFSPAGDRLASGGEDMTARIWNTVTGKELLQLGGFTNRVFGIAFSPDRQWLATASQAHNVERVIRVWDARTGQERFSLPVGGETSVVFSPDSQRIATVYANVYHVTVWDMKTHQPRLTLPGHQDMVRTLAFSPDGRRLASGSFDTTVKVWDVAPEQEFRPLFAWGPPSALLSGLVSLQIARVPSVRTLWGFTSRVTGVAFSPNGARLAAGGMDQIIRIWDTQTWREVLTFRDPTGGILSLAYSPDGQQIATGSTDSTVKLWNAKTGELLHTFHGHDNLVSAVAFSPDGERLASSSFDGTVKLWAVTP